MNPLLVVILMTLFMVIAGAEYTTLATVAAEVRAETRSRDLTALASDLDRYFRENGSFPTTLATLSATPGFEHVRPADTAALSYTKTTTPITGVDFQYDRAAIVSQDTTRATEASTLFSSVNNSCGTGDFSTATRWCGRNIDAWIVRESKDYAPDLLARQRNLLNKVARKLALYYTANVAFPNPGATNATLASLVGYYGSPTACSGSFTWQSIPWGCDDIFSVSGNPVIYTYVSSKSIVLAAATNLTNAAGNPVAIVMPIDLP